MKPANRTRPANRLHSLVFNSLEQQIAVIDKAGTILDVNHAWIDFGVENGMSPERSWVGRNYLSSLKAAAKDDSMAGKALAGLNSVLKGERASFSLEYPCHSDNEKRWFIMRIVPLVGDSRGAFVISHLNITQRKLAEERLQHLATQDPLTGLANRRHFDNVLETEIRRSARARTPISLIAIDLDNFKAYNDEHGHPRGDQCLVMVAAILRSAGRRPTDLAARLGGDEFALLLVDSDEMGSQRVAQKIINAIRSLGMTSSKTGQVTASIGVVTVVPDAKLEGASLIQDADNALYIAKNAGRDRVERTTPSNLMPVVQAG